MNTASGFRVDSQRIRVEGEPSEMKADGVAEPLSVAVPAAEPLDPLDLRVGGL